ncbi:MAG TPA: DUF302 domain-containing protein [Polyangiaceae bacterium]|nr:DUF302 domain-containing protein [Polyangiaceae bacterium]HMR80846.1 DUF302 domain-containing protein [Polyangiaceae bacterium]
MDAGRYGYETKVKKGFDETVAWVTEELAKEGFGVLTTIDVKATLKKKIDVDFRQYTILGACNPKLAHRALSEDAQMGLMLPCNVVVQESEAGGVEVSVINPNAMFGVMGDDRLKDVAEEADTRLRRVVAALS